MLKRISPLPGPLPESAVCVPIGRAGFPAPFPHGLEYSPPCRGTWNIVHTGMLIPKPTRSSSAPQAACAASS